MIIDYKNRLANDYISLANKQDMLLYSIAATENEGGIPLCRPCTSMHSLVLYVGVTQYSTNIVHTLAVQTHIGHHVSKKERKM